MSHVIDCSIPASHPSIPGHFPGNPIVPAVVILDEVIAACNEWQPSIRIEGISNAKFVSPLAPDQAFNIHLDAPGKGSIKFECRLKDRTLVTGKIQITELENQQK